jgi:hypothetical protein
VLREEVLKREVVEGDKAAVAAKQVARAENKALRRSGGKVPGEATIDDALTRASAVSTA